MKICKRILTLVLALVLLLTPVLTAPVFAADESNRPEKNTLYIYDLGAFLDTLPGTRIQYDYLKFATALQGLANRDGVHIYYKFWQAYANVETGIEIEEEWLEYLTEANSGNGVLNDGTDLADYEQVVVTDFWELVEMFADVAEGLVLWEESVPATANVASTIAGVENLLPVRYSTNPIDLYTVLVSGEHGIWSVKRSLVGLFDGKTIPTFESSIPGYSREVDTSVQSTLSIKNDPYIWAKINYLDEGKTNPNLMTFSLDGSSYQQRKSPEETLGCDAEIISINLPSYLQTGTTVKFQVNVKNTGTTTWERHNAFRLSLLENNTACPYNQSTIDAMTDPAEKAKAQAIYDEFWRNNTKLYRVESNGSLTADASWFNRARLITDVQPGESYTFDLAIVVPQKLGGHELEFTMVQDGSENVAGKFGETYRAPVMVTEEATVHASAYLVRDTERAEYLCANDENLALAIKNCADRGMDEAFVRSYLQYDTEGTVTLHAVNNSKTTWRATDDVELEYITGDKMGRIALEEDVAPGQSTAFAVPVSSGTTKAGARVMVTATLWKGEEKISNICTTGVEVIPSFGSEFISYTTTDEIPYGGKTTVALTWRNTGAFRWGDDAMNVCIGTGSRHLSAYGEADDATFHGYNYSKDSSYDVSYGQTYTYRVDVHTVPNPLTSNGKSNSLVSNGKLTLTFRLQAANGKFQYVPFGPKQTISWSVNKNDVPTNIVSHTGEDTPSYPISIISDNIPDFLNPGEVIRLNIETLNTGDETWYSLDHAENEHVLDEQTGELCENSNMQENICMKILSEADKDGENGFSLANDEEFTDNVGAYCAIDGMLDVATDESYEWTPYLRAPSKPGVYTLAIGFKNPCDDVLYGEAIEKVICVGEHEYVAETVCKTDKEAPVTTSPYMAEIMSYYTLDTVEAGQKFPLVVTLKNTGTNELQSSLFKGNTANSMRLSFAGAIGAKDADKNLLPLTNGAMAERFFSLCSQSMARRATEDHPYGQNGSNYDRMDFSKEMRVGSGEYFTYSGELVAPTTPGTYTVKLRGVQDGIAFRGDEVQLNFTVVDPVAEVEEEEIPDEGEVAYIDVPAKALVGKTVDIHMLVRNYTDNEWLPTADPVRNDGYVLRYQFNGKTKYASATPAFDIYSGFDFSLTMPDTVGEYPLTVQMFVRENGKRQAIGQEQTVNISVASSMNDEVVLQHGFYEANGSAYYKTADTDLFNSALPNADYYIANKAFFWDLSQEAEIPPLDDRNQPVGTDVKTLRSLLLSQMKQAQLNKSSKSTGLDGSGIFTVGGFVPWVLKYNEYADPLSGYSSVDAEWTMIDIISEYGGQTDADAFGTVGIINTSAYQHVALSVGGSVNPTQAKSSFNPEVGDASVKYNSNAIYLMFYMGDYDGGAWVGNLLKAIWEDPERGTLPLAWAICGNLADRIPHVYNYLYDTAKPNDYFVTGDNGAGYLNPQWMMNPSDTRITSRESQENRDSWIHYNAEINEKFKLGITGFYISATRGTLDEEVMQLLHQMTPYGVTDNIGKVTVVNGLNKRSHYGVYKPTTASEGTVATPFTYTYSTGKLNTPELINEAVKKVNNQIKYSGQFLSLRTVKALPSEINDFVEALQALNDKNKTGKTVTVVDPYTYFRLYKEANKISVNETYASLTQVGSNISFGDQLSIVMSYNLKNMPSAVTENYLKQNAGMLCWTSAADANACNLDTAAVSVGFTKVPASMNAGQYAAQTTGFTAKEASVYRYIRAYVDLPDGTRVYSAVKGYSPQLYANAILAKDTTTAPMRTLAKALLNYATAAQKYAGVAADANRDLSAADKALVFDSSSLVPATDINLNKTTTPDYAKFWGAKKNIRMKDNFNLLFFWQMDPSVVASASDSGVLVWTEDEYLSAKEISLASAPTKYPLMQTSINGAVHYGAEIVGIPARSIDRTVYACAYMTIGGVTYYSDLVNYSVHQYAQNKLNDANMGELVKRVVNYGLAAKAYYEATH